MNEDRKKYLRTQGKYEIGKIKSRDKRQKSSPACKDLPEKSTHERCSFESKGSNNSFSDDSISPIKYQENSDYSFEQLENSKKSIEIADIGKTVLSTTDNGDSILFYEPELLEQREADELFKRLYDCTNWYSKNIVINGEEKPQPRLVAWYGPYPYSYSGATLEPAEMTDPVLEIKQKLEEFLKENGFNATFNSVLLNLYRNGKDSVAWHSDDELTMGIRPTIASVSLGETRRFEMKVKRKYSEDESFNENKAEYFIQLTHGSLIVMDGCMQDDWQHRVPKEYHDKRARINLTFRTVYPLEKISNSAPTREFKKKQVDDYISKKAPSCTFNFDDANFPPLKTEPSSTHPCLNVKNDSLNNSSNSSLRSNDLNKSCENWDSETSSEEVKIKNETPINDHVYDSYCATSNVKCVESFIDDNENLFEMNSVESHLEDSMSPLDITEGHTDNKKNKKPWLNVSAKEFVPKNSLPYQGPDYSKIPLEELLHFKVELMHGEKLSKFSHHLKLNVQERLQEFSRFVREELELLCTITDGTQTDRNQKLISSRIVNIVYNNLNKHQTSPNFQRSYDRHPRTSSYGKQNYHTDRGRYYQNVRRDNNRLS